ncbi:MAG: hypothetical protein JW931_01315 [Methanomicrobiaceae archaeon]|nr:hypothetical protein [Methanomicrobiaceae archaeon]
MVNYKSIEERIAEYIADHYKSVVEVGIGRNTVTSTILKDKGIDVTATDIRDCPDCRVKFFRDDITAPDKSIYANAGLIYSVRPGVEMIPDLIKTARAAGADLIVYHLGNEIYENGGEIIDCGIILHRYYKND